MYVDESGDPGPAGSDFFILSGLIVNEFQWKAYLDQLVDFRKRMKTSFGLKMSEEIHASDFICKPGQLSRIEKHNRLAILRHFMDEIEALPLVDIINVAVDKRAKPATYDVFGEGWGALTQRLENTLANGNFKAQKDRQHGILIVDATNERLLRNRVRRMRYYNPIPSKFGTGKRNLPLTHIVEDPSHRNSAHSYFVQSVDCVAWMLKQQLQPCKYIQKNTGHGYFRRLDKSLCRVASPDDPQGIVKL